jgi:predicted Ser/Thr protein kinase
MPQVVPCPACGQHLKLPDALLGKSVKCKCSHVFIAPLPSVTCPVCNAVATEDAVACPDCGYHFTPQAAPALPKPEEDEKLNICPNAVCGTLNPPGERLCQRCNSPLPGAVGQVIAGNYRLEQALATGGFGVVYRASVVKTGEPVAVKEMIATDAKEFTIRQTFFRREAEILRSLQHLPIVPRLHDYIEEGSAAYLVMEFIPGDNLLSLLDKPGAKPFPVRQVAAWGAKIAEALAHMHRMKPALIHRDMKPENIMLLPDGATIRLIDFGTAREMGHGPRERAVAKTKVFTEGYAPQEQVGGKPEPRSDLFALAGTLYHLASGKAPDGHFTGQELMKKIAEYPEPDRWFWEIVATNLSQEVCDRYMTARDMRGDLERGSITREIHCPACGTATPAREPYCRGCACAIAPAGMPCHKCERPTLLGSRFCVTCGARL